MTCVWSMIIVDVFLRCEVVVLYAVLLYLFIYLTFSSVAFFGARNFHNYRRALNEKPGNGVDLWRRFLERATRTFTVALRPNIAHCCSWVFVASAGVNKYLSTGTGT